jgi:hypothetical protein
VRDAFQILPSRTLTSRPSVRSCPSGGCNLAKFPGNSSPKMIPKSLQVSQTSFPVTCGTHPLTFSQVLSRASRLYRSSSTIVSWIIDLSFTTVAIIFLRACSFFSTLHYQINSNPRGKDSLVNHVHDLCIDFPTHAFLLRLEFTTLISCVSKVDSVEIVR